MQRQHSSNNKKGFVTLLSVIIIGAAASIMIVSGLLITTDSANVIGKIRDAMIAKNYADTCAEVALNKLKSTSTYAGNETINLTYGTCTVISVSGSGNTNRIIQARGNVANITRKVQISVTTINPSTMISSWQEIE